MSPDEVVGSSLEQPIATATMTVTERDEKVLLVTFRSRTSTMPGLPFRDRQAMKAKRAELVPVAALKHDPAIHDVEEAAASKTQRVLPL